MISQIFTFVLPHHFGVSSTLQGNTLCAIQFSTRQREHWQLGVEKSQKTRVLVQFCRNSNVAGKTRTLVKYCSNVAMVVLQCSNVARRCTGARQREMGGAYQNPSREEEGATSSCPRTSLLILIGINLLASLALDLALAVACVGVQLSLSHTDNPRT